MMSENLTPEQASRVLVDDFGVTRDEVAKLLLLTAVFLNVRVELESGEMLTVSYREGGFGIQGGKMVREVESLDEQALQEQAVQLELFPEDHREDSWESSPPGTLRVFEEYEDLTGDFD